MIAFGLILAACAAANGPVYIWPLDLPPQLSSSFAEYRTGRFHAGIDLRTGGTTGHPVRAPRDGYVSRIRCSPWGYGKAVYITFDDGNSVVFGHLDSFDEALTRYVREAQHERRSYEVDLYPEADRFPVRAGQIVAHSGETGIGPAHLHYELRDANQNPIHPGLLGITWPDDTTPVIRKLLVTPDGPESSVNGDLKPQVVEVRSAGPGRYTSDPVRITGRVGFGVDVIDPANNGNNALGVYELRTRCEDASIFTVRHDRISYDANYDGVVSYHPFFLSEGRFLLQWRWPGNRAEPFQTSPADGWLAAPDRRATAVIEAVDFAGHVAALEIPLTPGGPAKPPPPPASDAGTGSMSLQCMGTWILVTAAFPNPEPESPVLEVEADGATVSAPAFRRVSSTMLRAGYAPAEGVQRVTVRARHPRATPFEESLFVFHSGETRVVEADGLRMSVNTDSPFGTLFARVERLAPPDPPEIEVHGNAFRIWPDEMPIRAPVELAFTIPATATGKTEVYRLASWGWAREATERRNGEFVVKTRRFGTYALMTDTQPPIVAITSPSKETPPARRPAIRARVSDIGSGIADVAAYCGPQWLLMAYDPEAGAAAWEQDQDLPSGTHELRITATDGAGNTTSQSVTVTVPQ